MKCCRRRDFMKMITREETTHLNYPRSLIPDTFRCQKSQAYFNTQSIMFKKKTRPRLTYIRTTYPQLPPVITQVTRLTIEFSLGSLLSPEIHVAPQTNSSTSTLCVETLDVRSFIRRVPMETYTRIVADSRPVH
jgi:hypothetical protein